MEVKEVIGNILPLSMHIILVLGILLVVTTETVTLEKLVWAT